MSNTTIPNELGQIRQFNRGDIFGELTETFNIDLSTNVGKIKTSKKLKRVLSNATLNSATGINKFLIYNSVCYAHTNQKIHRCSINDDLTVSANWSEVTAISGDQDASGDMVVFDSLLRISDDTDIQRYDGSASYNASWWIGEISGAALTANYPHILHIHRGGAETLFVTDKNKVRYYNASAGHSTVTLQNDLVASCVDSGVSAIWVGSYTETSENAYVYEMYVGEQLNGAPVARNAYKVDGRAVLALWVSDNIPYIVTEKGYIQAFNGAGFTTVAEFPFVLDPSMLDGVRPGLVQNQSVSRPIHPNGVDTHGDSVFILINTTQDVIPSNSFPVTTRSHSGVWEYNSETKVLHHRYAFADDTTDKGASAIESSGALLVADELKTFILAGTNTDVGVGLFAESDEQSQGYFVTKEIMSQTIKDSYKAVYHKAKTLAPTESIVTQYRATKRDTVYGTINWLSPTSFTTTDDWSLVLPADAENNCGELVRISSGYGAGEYANVISKETSFATYSFTIDRAIGATGQSSFAYSDSFRRIETEYTTEDGELKQVGVDIASPWIQFMVILKGNVEYRQFICNGNAKNEL